jgi:hypothetical protein
MTTIEPATALRLPKFSIDGIGTVTVYAEWESCHSSDFDYTGPGSGGFIDFRVFDSAGLEITDTLTAEQIRGLEEEAAEAYC